MNDMIANVLGSWSVEFNTASLILRMVLSLVLASIIGCERSSKRHSAGMRTFILVTMSATAAMLTDLYIGGNGDQIPVISAAAVVGIAMLSGNSVLFSSKNQIKGLTTSAALWSCGFMGLLAGAGMYTATILVFLGILCALSLFPTAEHYLKDRSNHFEVHLELVNSSRLQDFVTTIRKLGIRIDDIESNPAYLNSGLSVYTISLTVNSQEQKLYKRHSEIIEALRSLDYIHHIEEMN